MTAINKWWQITRIYHQTRIMKILEILQWTFKMPLSSNTKGFCPACKLLGAGSYVVILFIYLFFFIFGKDFDVAQVNEQLN